MKTLHLYLTRRVLATLGMTVLVFTFILMLGNVIKEILGLLITRQATLALAVKGILLLIPYVLAFSLPIGMLTATLLVFGRFSADQELTAARASGISLVSLISPILVLSVLLSGLCAWLNFEIAPSSRVAYNELLHRAGLQRPGGLLRSMEDTSFGRYTVFAGKVHGDGTNLENVIVSEWDEKGVNVHWASGATGEIEVDTVNKQIYLTLHGASSAFRDNNGWQPGPGGDLKFQTPLNFDAGASLPVPISDMTFRQLRQKLRQMEQGTVANPPRGASKAELVEAQRQLRAAAAQRTMPPLVYLNQQVSFSFACIGFTLVGIPLGIRGHRRETSVGVATALILVLIYYAFIVMAQSWVFHPERAPYLIVWIPNFIFQAVGAVLLWRGNKNVC